MGAVVRTLRTAFKSSFLFPRDDSRRMSVSSLSRSSVWNCPATSVPTASISLLLTSIMESASRIRRFSAATKTRAFCPTVARPLDGPQLLVRAYSSFDYRSNGFSFGPAPPVARSDAFLRSSWDVLHKSPLSCHMPTVMMSDLLEPRALPCVVQFYSRDRIRAHSCPGRGTQRGERFAVLTLWITPPQPVSIWYQTSCRASNWDQFLYSSSPSALYGFFSTARPFPFVVLPYYHFAGTSHFLLGTFPL